jgi:hypothetical protein
MLARGRMFGYRFQMITAFVLTGPDDSQGLASASGHDERALARTLNGLISAAVDGLVREVVLLADDSNQAARSMADHCGGTIVSTRDFAKAASAARGQWLLMLEAGAMLELGWLEHVSTHIQASIAPARFARSGLSPRPLWQRLFQPERALALGLLLAKAEAETLLSAANGPHAMAKKLRPRALAAAIRPAF